MSNEIIVAIIGGMAAIFAAIIAILPKFKKNKEEATNNFSMKNRDKRDNRHRSCNRTTEKHEREIKVEINGENSNNSLFLNNGNVNQNNITTRKE